MEINFCPAIYITSCLEALGNLKLQSARSYTEYNSRPTAEDMMKQVGKITRNRCGTEMGIINPTTQNLHALTNFTEQTSLTQKPPVGRFGYGQSLLMILFSPLRKKMHFYKIVPQ